MSVFKRPGSPYCWFEFSFNGQRVRRSTKQSNWRAAVNMEAAFRTALAKGEVGILQRSVPTLTEFLKNDFEPYIKTQHKTKANTLDYYLQGSKKLKASQLANLKLDQITGQQVTAYIAKRGQFEKSTINRDLRTLRRALNLALDWGKYSKRPKVVLLKGENRRERVLTDAEAEKYLAACPQPWKDVATLMLGTGMRPGECYQLRWEHVALNENGGYVHVAAPKDGQEQGKTKSANRVLPMVPQVHRALKARHDSQGRPSQGWVFPTDAKSEHMMQGSAKQWHEKALAVLEKAHKEKPKENPEVKPFEPYILRHTALTNLAAVGVDVFALAKIAGHSRISTTERYIHPQTEAVELAFSKIAGQPVGARAALGAA